MWYEAIWFFSGVLLYSFFSKLLNVGTSVVFFRTVQAEALVYLGTAVESIAFINEIKYSAMKEAERPVEQIKAMRLVDDETDSNCKNKWVATTAPCSLDVSGGLASNDEIFGCFL